MPASFLLNSDISFLFAQIIDNIEIAVNPALTIMQACEGINTEIPRFCYHERLSIAGNCRMCLVEVVGGPPNLWPLAPFKLRI